MSRAELVKWGLIAAAGLWAYHKAAKIGAEALDSYGRSVDAALGRREGWVGDAAEVAMLGAVNVAYFNRWLASGNAPASWETKIDAMRRQVAARIVNPSYNTRNPQWSPL